MKSEIFAICSKSFYFSHKVIWFLNSLVDSKNTTFDPDAIILEIKEISVKQWKFCLTGSDNISQFLNNRGDEQRDSTLQVIKNYHKGLFDGCIYTEWIPLGPFGSKEKDPYYSTLLFFDRLYEISLNLNSVSNKTEYLKNELEHINSYLPAGVYIPFNSEGLRDCSLLNVRTSELIVYSTKEKSPYRITLELYCPNEELKMSFEDNKQEIKLVDKNPRKSSNGSTCAFEGFNGDYLTVQEYFSENKMIRAIPEEENTGKSVSVLSDRISCMYGVETGENQQTFIYEDFFEQEARVRASSPYGSLISWRMVNIIVKTGDDLRQEQLAIQLFTFFQQIFNENKLNLWLHPYEIIPTHKYGGIIECVKNAVSIDYLKKNLPSDQKSLIHYFVLNFGQTNTKRFKKAREEFLKSLAGYSLACFILKLKDRHNGNILIDTEGHIIHIDFGFMLSNSPGGNMNFESAPFKLTEEFEQVLGGRHSRAFNKFRRHCVEGFLALSRKAEQIILMVEMMRTGSGASLPCFVAGEGAVDELRNRLVPFGEMSKAKCKKYINQLIDTSLDHWTTRWYDRVQYFFQGTLY